MSSSLFAGRKRRARRHSPGRRAEEFFSSDGQAAAPSRVRLRASAGVAGKYFLLSIRAQSTLRDRSDAARPVDRRAAGPSREEDLHGRSPAAARDRNKHGVRSRLAVWIAAGAVGLTAAGAVGSARPAVATEAAATTPAATSTSTSRPTPAATTAAVRDRPAYTVHQVLPHAPANAVALTLDDGPDPSWTPRVLALLRRQGVHATFCLVGRQAKAHPDLVRQIVADGHALCNHSMTHPQPFAHRSAAEIEQQINDAQSAITNAAGTAPRLFRAPGGDWSPAVFASAAKHGLTPIGWDVDPKDWSRPGTQKIISSLLAAKPGDILLCHDGDGNRSTEAGTDRSETVKALEVALPQLKNKGYTFVKL